MLKIRENSQIFALLTNPLKSGIILGMEMEKKLNFALPILLKFDELNMQKIAAGNLTLSVGGYFSLLSRFISEAPAAMEAMSRIAALNEKKDDLQTVINIKALLEDMGCKKFILILSDIISALNKGNKDFAANCIKSVLADFNQFLARITSAQTETASSASDDLSNSVTTVPSLSESLKKVLDRIDREKEFGKPRILVVDDSETVLQTISSLLDDEYKVFGLKDPLMIEKFLQQISPELFLIDYQMPDRSGLELISIIRNFDEHKNTPIIIMTSLGTIDLISASQSLGACDFIVKPIQDVSLRKKITKHIKKK